LAPRVEPTRDVVKLQAAATTTTEKSSPPIDVGLGVCFLLWYLGNYYYNITNKLALKVTKRKNMPFETSASLSWFFF